MESSTKNTTSNEGSPSRNKKYNGWNKKKEKLLKYWQEECRLYVWFHNKNSSYYRKLNRLLTIPSILITAITSTALFSTNNDNNDRAVILGFGILLIIGTFLQSTREFLDIEKQIHRNVNSSISYQSIVNEIEEQLTQDILDRMDGRLFLRKIKNTKNDIVRNGPSISSGTWNKLKRGMKNGEVINLYGTDFFQGYINNLDALDKDDEDNEFNQGKRQSMPAVNSMGGRTRRNSAVISSFDLMAGLNNRTPRKRQTIADFNKLEKMRSNTQQNNNIMSSVSSQENLNSNIKVEEDKENKKPKEVRIDITPNISNNEDSEDIYSSVNNNENNNDLDAEINNEIIVYNEEQYDPENIYEYNEEINDDDEELMNNNFNMQQIRNKLMTGDNDVKTSKFFGKKQLNYQMNRM